MGNGKRVLVVDDDEATVALFQTILEVDHWEVETSNSGREATAKIQPARYDLVVCDLNMPEVNGIEVYQAAIETDPELRRRFLFVSGYADSDAAKAFLLEAGCPVLRKPIQLEEFRAVTAQVAAAQPLQVPALPAPWFTPHSQNLYSGDINGRHTLVTLLNRINTARLTGVLHVVHGRVEKRLFFTLGRLIFAASNADDDGLGEVMLRAGALTQAKFDEVSELVRKGFRFGAALVELHLCEKAQLEDWVRQQLTHIASSIFQYAAGHYYFFDSFDENISPEFGLALPLGRLVHAGVHEARGLPFDELARDETLFLDLSPDPVVRFQDVDLTEDERFLLAKIERPLRATDALQASGLPSDRAARALYALLALGMVSSIAPVARQPKAEPAPRPAPLEPPLPTPVTPAAPAPAQVPAAAAHAANLAEFESEMKKMLELADTGTHYQLLGVTSNSSASDIKRSFYKLAKQFHPDRHMGRSEWIGSLQKIMDALSVSYKLLTDERSKVSYDERLAESGAFTVGRAKTVKQETAGECLEKAKECLRAKNFAGSIVWLRKCVDVAPNDSKYRAMLARSLGAVPQYRQEAIEQFEAAIRLDPWNTSAHFQFAELYEAMKLPWRARAFYQKILDIDPQHSKALERIRQLDAQEGKKDDKGPGLLGRVFGR